MSIEIQPNEKEITTPSGEHKLIIKAYLTGYDKREYRNKLIALSKEATEENQSEIGDKFENYKIEKVVISVDGSADNIVEKVLAMKVEDTNFVQDLVDQMILGLSKKNGSPSSISTPTSSEEESLE